MAQITDFSRYGPDLEPEPEDPGSTANSDQQSADPNLVWSEPRFPTPPGRKDRRWGSVSEVCSAVLRDGKVLEIVQDYHGRTCFMVWQNGETWTSSSENADGGVLEPVRRSHPVLRWMHLPTNVREYESPARLAREIGEFVSGLVPLPSSSGDFIGTWVLHTWGHFQLPNPPFVIARGSRESCEWFLKILSLVSRNALVIADTTPKAFLHANVTCSPTFLVLDWGLRADFLRVLKMGVRPEVLVLGQNEASSLHGSRLLACSDTPSDPELLSDAIVFSLPPDTWPRFEKQHHPAVREQARRLRNSLLLFRLRSCAPLALVAGDPPPGWTPKRWDMFRSFCAPVSSNAEFCDQVRLAFDDFEVAPLPPLPPAKFATLKAVFSLAHRNVRDVSVIELSKKANEALEELGEATISPRRAGAVLAELGFPKRARGDHGNHKIEFHRPVLERIHELALQSELKIWITPEMAASCPLCRDSRRLGEGDIPEVEQDKPAEEPHQTSEGEEQQQAQAEVPKATTSTEQADTLPPGQDSDPALPAAHTAPGTTEP
jgi:hypothetical protein